MLCRKLKWSEVKICSLQFSNSGPTIVIYVPPSSYTAKLFAKNVLEGEGVKKITLYVFIANFKFWSNNCDISPRITAVGEVSKSHKIQTGPFPMAIPMDIPIYIQSFVTPSFQPTLQTYIYTNFSQMPQLQVNS